MKFADDFSANIILRRNIAPATANRTINCYGKEQNILITDTSFEATDTAGKKIKKKRYKIDPANTISASLENFALCITEPDENKLICQPGEHLKNMATIEAAYLSSRTAMPEEPGRILELSGNI
jgi:predicted dehydrogenase